MDPMGQEMYEVLEAIEEWIEDLGSNYGNWIMLVEGKKDISALKNLGLDLEMSHLNKGLSNLDLLETIWRSREGSEGIVILTDWDRTGGRLAKSLGEKCLSLGIPCDLEKRKEISRMTGKWIQDMESLDTFYQTISTDVDHPRT